LNSFNHFELPILLQIRPILSKKQYNFTKFHDKRQCLWGARRKSCNAMGAQASRLPVPEKCGHMPAFPAKPEALQLLRRAPD